MKTTVVLAAGDYAKNRKKWLEARLSGLGASETAAVLGVDPWATPLDVYLSKVNPDHTREVGEAAEWGTAIEAVVARMVAKRHPHLGKLTPTPGLLSHPEHPWMLATPDRLLVDKTTGREALLEIKTTDMRNKPLWDGAPPLRVQVQVQQQLAVTGLDVAYVAVLFGGREMPTPYRIERDDKTIDLIIEHGGQFWHEHVLAKVAPEPTIGDDGNLTVLYPGDTDLDPLIADESLQSLFERRAVEAAKAKEAKEALEAIDLQVKAAMGDRITVTDFDGRVLATWKPQSSTRFDSKTFKEKHPAMAATYTTTTTTRVFRVKGTTTNE